MPPLLELVVARHREDLRWLRRVPREFAVTVYNKGPDFPGAIPLPNTGREAHTYLGHLAARHTTLAELTVFVQGHPFDHAPDLHKILRSLADRSLSVGGFHWLGFLAETDDRRGRRLFVPWSKNPGRAELPLDAFHEKLFSHPGPETYRFFVGAQFILARPAAHRRDPAFYARARDLAAADPRHAHCFERCWDRVFLADGTAHRMPPGQRTAYFKPIKRLQTPPPHPA
jgi:hypothetical protein